MREQRTYPFLDLSKRRRPQRKRLLNRRGPRPRHSNHGCPWIQKSANKATVMLTLYLDDGRIEMDTNAVERAMRPIKLNAKNALFAGCDEGAENWALLASLIETCKLNGVSAEHWLSDVLAKLVNGWPAARLDELLPWGSTYTMHAHDPRLAA
ncbi:transposase domain-containing protein [Bradyrhizobium sp. 142]|uniref:transposase domain-containing protein n=1 Tax=Bradyrhizobium sp. 142 TaxID=2782618 RepID=UPI0021119705|nr:transposase domain-containing protein [Bradyrhizobium sp. 142]